MVEVGTGVLFGLVAYLTGSSIATLVVLVYACFFVVIIFIDLDHRRILNKIVFPGMVIALPLFPFGATGGEVWLGEAYLRSAAGGLLGFGAMLIIYLLSRGGMGEGDVKFGALAGLATGFPQVIVTLLMSFISGGVSGLLVDGIEAQGSQGCDALWALFGRQRHCYAAGRGRDPRLVSGPLSLVDGCMQALSHRS